MELCELGSLQTYIRDNYQYCQVTRQSLAPEFVLDLDRWSREVAQGMEFLAENKVVHADLATRNVLLTSDKIAKVSDFGLSRKLYDYSQYVKKHQEPLPWRWLSPESLLRLEFNEKTDVWAFGVTLWEIYSVGNIPYPGLSWNAEFVSSLGAGLRLQRPKFCQENIYSIMCRCWAMNPALRPTFAQLNQELRSQSFMYQNL